MRYEAMSDGSVLNIEDDAYTDWFKEKNADFGMRAGSAGEALGVGCKSSVFARTQ